jgi:hypothetical protein
VEFSRFGLGFYLYFKFIKEMTILYLAVAIISGIVVYTIMTQPQEHQYFDSDDGWVRSTIANMPRVNFTLSFNNTTNNNTNNTNTTTTSSSNERVIESIYPLMMYADLSVTLIINLFLTLFLVRIDRVVAQLKKHHIFPAEYSVEISREDAKPLTVTPQHVHQVLS